VALSPLTTLTRMLIDGFGGIPVSSPSSSSTSGPPAVWGERFADGSLHVNQSDGLWSVEARGPIVLLPVVSREETLLARWPQNGPMVVLAYGAAGVETAPQAPADPG
jgi:hypothetical protein